jgi:cytochrome c553
VIERIVPRAVLLASSLALLPASAIADDARRLAYGKHLAQDCTGCHRIDGTDNGIPSIVAWDKDTFITTLKFYKDGVRPNPAMVSVATSLDDEQMAALAAFYSALPKPDKKPAAAAAPMKAKK